MTGGKAIELMNEGKRVKVPEWKGYWFKKNGCIYVMLEDGTEIKQEDITWINTNIWRTDWQVVE